MNTIYKYELPDVDNVIALPMFAKVLHVAEQHGCLSLWAQVDPEAPGVEKRRFLVVGTGNPIPYGGETVHVGSMLTAHGTFVFHVFEVTGP